jgi:hypothetical protein
MRPRIHRALGVALAAAGLLAAGLIARPSRGDDPPRLGRLFRFGSNASSKPSKPPEPPATDAYGNPLPSTAGSLPPSSSPFSTNGGGSAGSRIIPQPRVSRPVTESDPILTRIAIGRSDDGKQFGMCLQVFADGTVLDSEGVHRVGSDILRPLAQAIQATDSSRLKGHCGGPPADFIEQIHVVIYERAYGKLRANAFSYSGNPQGCEPAVRHLHAAIEALQTKISGSSVTGASNGVTGASNGATVAAPSNLAAPVGSAAPPIPLTNP